MWRQFLTPPFDGMQLQVRNAAAAAPFQAHFQPWHDSFSFYENTTVLHTCVCMPSFERQGRPNFFSKPVLNSSFLVLLRGGELNVLKMR